MGHIPRAADPLDAFSGAAQMKDDSNPEGPDPRDCHRAYLRGSCHPDSLTQAMVTEAGQIIVECAECERVDLKNPPPMTCENPACVKH